MYTPEMLESIARVEAHRAQNLATEPRRMTAEEKEALLKAYHPDYREDQFTSLQVGPNAGGEGASGAGGAAPVPPPDPGRGGAAGPDGFGR